MITQTARKISSFTLTITVLAVMSGCASQSAPTPGYQRSQLPASQKQRTSSRKQILGERAAAVALQQIGVPYQYGGASRRGFDCSGLVQFSYKAAGKPVPRTTGQLWSNTHIVSQSDLRAGDILFFRIEGKMSHVGMYIGGKRFVHAPSSGRTVSVEHLDSPFYAAAFIRGGRPR